MVRAARCLREGCSYYIKSQSRADRAIFRGDADYRYYLRLLKKYKEKFRISIYGFCLRPSGIYLVVGPRDTRALPLFMQGLSQSYALYFNARYKHKGKVWGQRYKSMAIAREFNLLACIQSVESVPVVEKECQLPGDYPWSSHADRVSGVEDIVEVPFSVAGGCAGDTYA